MPSHRLPARFNAATTLAALFASTVAIGAPATASAASAAASSAAATATPGAARDPTEVFQQRGANGSIVLTDRPSPTRTTERIWQIEREDPVAARQRAEAVRREAQTVSERVQRRLDSQHRLAAEVDLQRLQLDAAERERQLELARIEAERDRAPYSPYFYPPDGYAPGLRLGVPFAQPPLAQGRFGQERFGQEQFGEGQVGQVGQPRIGERRPGGPRIGERSEAGPRIGEGRFDAPRLGLRREPDGGRPQPPRKHPHATPRRADALGRVDGDEQ